MYRYFFIFLLILITYLFFSELLPTYRNVSFCTNNFENNYTRVGLLDDLPSGISGEKICTDQRKQIIELENCLKKSSELDLFDGFTNLVFMAKVFFNARLNSLEYEKRYFNNACDKYPNLKF